MNPNTSNYKHIIKIEPPLPPNDTSKRQNKSLGKPLKTAPLLSELGIFSELTSALRANYGKKKSVEIKIT
jgi:hypothetical protein